MDQTAEITALAAQLSSDNLALWSDDKRNDFVNTFDARIRVARYILLQTATHVANLAFSKHFISQKHLDRLPREYHSSGSELIDGRTDGTQRGYFQNSDKIGGRPFGELNKIAEERAMDIIEKLPRLSDAVRIISPEVSQMIEKKNKLAERGKQILKESEDLTSDLDMDDLPQTTTIAEFRQMVLDRQKKRRTLIAKLDEIGKEGQSLDSRINKFLYNGLPGLSDAVIRVVIEYIERYTGFSALNRRVAEQVKFGDSEAAMEMLRTFEKDEVKVSSDIQGQFDAALDALKVAAKRSPAKKSLTASTKKG